MTQQAKIVPFQAHHILLLDLREEQKYYFEYFPTAQDMYQYGELLLQMAIDMPDGTKCAWTCETDGAVIACGGISNVTPHVGECWTLMGKDMPQYMLTCIREIKRQIKLCNRLRMQAFADVGFNKAHKFLKFLGFEYEATLEKTALNGTDQKLYKIIKEN